MDACIGASIFAHTCIGSLMGSYIFPNGCVDSCMDARIFLWTQRLFMMHELLHGCAVDSFMRGWTHAWAGTGMSSQTGTFGRPVGRVGPTRAVWACGVYQGCLGMWGLPGLFGHVGSTRAVWACGVYQGWTPHVWEAHAWEAQALPGAVKPLV
eukprot:347417-Chlamydomonas_euryale.AAC.10